MTSKSNQSPPSSPVDAPEKPSVASRFFAYLRGCFLTGIVVTAPVALSLYIVWSILIWIDDRVGEIVPLHLTGEGSIPGLGIVLAVCFFILIGWFARNFIGLILLEFSDFVLERLPLVKTVYGALKQVFEMVMGKQAQAFREVVMIEFPRKDVWTMGFLTGKTNGELAEKIGESYLNVFVPTTPNPTSGFLMMVPEKDVKRLDMSVDEGLKAIVSCGLIMPRHVASVPTKDTPQKES